MKKWKTLEVRTLLNTPYFDVVKDRVEDFVGVECDYYRLSSNGFVMVVPVKMNDKGEPTYVMIRQYRHPIGVMSLEFPAGRRESNETGEDAARRELLEETGYTAKNIKFIYSTSLIPARSADQQLVYLVEVEGTPGEPKREASEIGSAMETVEMTSDQLHRAVLANEIYSGCSLAALCVVLLNSKKATEYLGGM
jgi:ADP-ribose pyrophosphatase